MRLSGKRNSCVLLMLVFESVFLCFLITWNV